MTNYLGSGLNIHICFFQCLVVVCLNLWSGCANPLAPSQINLTGNWSGDAQIGYGFDTPLRMELTDVNGALTGTGGASWIDCRYYTYCGSFAGFTVSGTHNGSQIILDGNSIYGESWRLSGSLDSTGTLLSGTGTGGARADGTSSILPMFQDFPWSMERVTDD